MQLAQLGIQNTFPKRGVSPYPDVIGVNTTAGGKQAFLVVGDSLAQGSNNSSGPGPTPTAGTVQQWNGSAVIDIGSADVYNIPAGGGTCMPRMGINYNAATSRIPVFIPQGSSGAEFSPNGDNNNWSSTGTLRGTAQTQVTNCLADLGLTQLKGIIVILGINDARAATTLATVQTDIDSFFTWLTSTYPGVPIQVAQIGRTESVTGNARIHTVRQRIRANAISNTDVHMSFNVGSWISSGGYGADLLHPNQTGMNNMGASFARWWANLSYTKWARSIIAQMYSDITTARKTAVQDWVTLMGTDLFDLGFFHWLKMSDANDLGCDWAFMELLHLNTGDVTLNQYLATNGTDDSFESTFNNSTSTLVASQNDVFAMALIATDGATGTRTLFGGSNTHFFRLTQGNIQYVVNDQTTRTVSPIIGEFADNEAHGIFRNGTTKGYLLGSAEHDTIVTASTGAVNRNLRFGAFNNGALSQFIECQYICGAGGSYANINYPNFITATKALAAAW